MTGLQASLWPAGDVDRAVRAVARAAGMPVRGLPAAVRGSADGSPSAAAAREADLRLSRVGVVYEGLRGLLEASAPAVLRLRDGGSPVVACLVRRRRGSVILLGPDLRERPVPIESLRAKLAEPLEAGVAAEIDGLVADAEIATARRGRARAHLLNQRLAGTRFADCWVIERRRETPIWRQLRGAGLAMQVGRLVLVHLSQFLIWIAAWWTLGHAIFADSLSSGWLSAWILLLLALVPARSLGLWYQGVLSIEVGSTVKRQLLRGALKADLDDTRRSGVGQLLARVVEAEAVETLAISGGLLSLLAGIELAVALPLISRGAGGWAHSGLLLAWLALIAALSALQWIRQTRWTDRRLAMTEDLLEKMVGHRTRAVQEDIRGRHDAEDTQLQEYVDRATLLDRTRWVQTALAGWGWMVASVLVLAPGFLAGTASPGALAAGLGLTLLAQVAIQQLVAGQSHLIGAVIAWRRAGGMLRDAARAEPAPAVRETGEARVAGAEPRLTVRDLTFRHREGDRALLDRCRLDVAGGDRIVLEGASGSGKSTLLSLMTGLRPPHAGRIAVDGLEREAIGSQAWTRRVVSVPQFHENHILTGTLAFNLLMGRAWPPGRGDLTRAEDLCRELGLGELLDRMPSGLFQLVGETGWHLSHGERSRVFIARALLQEAPVVLLDESFAALDARNLRLAMDCVDRHADALVVVAHP